MAFDLQAGTMGFKASVAIVQTTRFKRKSLSSANFSPPATPFNNTSFLIRLQQLREQYSPKNLRFDQYGSMENMIRSSFAAPLQHPNNSSARLQHSNQSSNVARINLPCDSDHQQQVSSCSDDASSSVSEVNFKPEIREGDGMRRCQNFMDDNFDIHARGSGSDL